MIEVRYMGIAVNDPLYDHWVIPGDNVYDQDLSMPGQPSVFPAKVNYTGYVGNFYWSIPIIARMQEAITNYAGWTGYQAPPVPHSTSVGDIQASAPRSSRQSDIGLASLKAPRFATSTDAG